MSVREPLLGNSTAPSNPGFFGWVSSLFNPSSSSTSGSNMKIEPKTFFANERTLLSWLNVAVLLATLSLTLLNFGVSTSRVAGLILAPVSIFFIIYAYVVYARRNASLVNKEPIEYNNMVGPTVLVITLVIALTTIILLNVFYGGELALAHKTA